MADGDIKLKVTPTLDVAGLKSLVSGARNELKRVTQMDVGDNKQLQNLQVQAVKVQNKLQQLGSAFNAVFNQKIPEIPALKRTQAQIKTVEAEFNKLIDKQEQFEQAGVSKSSTQWTQLQQTIETTGAKLNQLKSQETELSNAVQNATTARNAKLANIGGQMQVAAMQGNNIASQMDKISNASQQASQQEENLGNTANRTAEKHKQLSKSARSAFNFIKSGAKMAKSAVSGIVNAIKK